MTDSELALFNGLCAFSAMYGQIEPRLKSAAVRMLRDAAEVAEFMCDCQAFLLVSALSFDPKRSAFADWAERTVVNECRKRREQLDKEISLDDIADEPDSRDLIAECEDRVDLEMAVAKLPPMQKKCWQLSEEGYTHSEIARMEGISVDAADKNIQRARIFIRSDMSA